MIAIKFKFKMGAKPYSKDPELDWSDRDAIDHWTNKGRVTACGCRIVGGFDAGWVLTDGSTREVTCKRCLSAIDPKL